MRDGKPCILVADDDAEILGILDLLLTCEGYSVMTAGDGISAAQADTEDIDLYILDVNMPGQSGLMAASQIRKRSDAPIVFLTAYSGESDKVMGFSVGADDYIVKPFSNAELLMRIRAILRRSMVKTPSANASNRLPFQDLVLDLDSQSVHRGDETIALTHTEFMILKLLVTNRKKIFSMDNLYRSIWEDDAVGDGAIMAHVKNLRKKLGDSSKNPSYIKTAWGKGYYID